jgi:hypothetical protein
MRACSVCGEPVRSGDPRKLYCSPKCKQRAWRQQRGVTDRVTDPEAVIEVERVTDQGAGAVDREAIIDGLKRKGSSPHRVEAEADYVERFLRDQAREAWGR